MDDGLVIASQPSYGTLERLLDGISQVFFWPVVACVLLMFAFALVSLGSTLIEAIQRKWRRTPVRLLRIEDDSSIESVELQILRQLELFRLCSRVAPMLGLVATMVPLGPALASLSSSGPAVQTQTLGHSFAVVIIALIAASITFSIYTVRRRWLLTELNDWIESSSESEERSA